MAEQHCLALSASTGEWPDWARPKIIRYARSDRQIKKKGIFDQDTDHMQGEKMMYTLPFPSPTGTCQCTPSGSVHTSSSVRKPLADFNTAFDSRDRCVPVGMSA